MATNFFNVYNTYSKDKSLRKEDVNDLILWTKNQLHLPVINEAQAVLFLHRWHFALDVAKTAIDTYFTVRTYCSDLFLGKNLSDSVLKQNMDISLYTVLSQKSHQGYSAYLAKIIIPDSNRYFEEQLIRIFNAVLSLHFYQTGPSEGYILIFDVKDYTLELAAKTDPSNMRKLFYYIQKSAPVKFKQFHLINSGPSMEKFLTVVKPFLEKGLAEGLFIHQDCVGLYEYIPQSGLPKDYGGSGASLAELQIQMKQKILENIELFAWEEGQIVDESKRLDKSTNIVDLLEKGSIRNGKFEID